MGGRGAAREREYYRDRHGKFVKYGEEYTTLLQHGRIKFVTTANKSDSVTSPRETRTQGRVYVTVSSKGKLKSITFYSTDGRKRVQIDLDHKHKGEMPRTARCQGQTNCLLIVSSKSGRSTSQNEQSGTIQDERP